eukprot:526245-Pyramimonas_sp.AAC.1
MILGKVASANPRAIYSACNQLAKGGVPSDEAWAQAVQLLMSNDPFLGALGKLIAADARIRRSRALGGSQGREGGA